MDDIDALRLLLEYLASDREVKGPIDQQPGVVLPEPQPIHGGFRIGQFDAHHVDVILMLFNWRIQLVPIAEDWSVEGGWCYVGTSQVTFVRAVGAAMAWLTAGGTEPLGWNKNVRSGEWREDG